MYSIMKDGRRGIRYNYNSIHIFLRYVPISKQVSLYPATFLSINKLLSILIIRPAPRGGRRGREEALSPKEDGFLKEMTIAVPITAVSQNRGVLMLFSPSVFAAVQWSKRLLQHLTDAQRMSWCTPRGFTPCHKAHPPAKTCSQRTYHCECSPQVVTRHWNIHRHKRWRLKHTAGPCS